MFKGTKNRTAKQIAEEIDAAGGQMNAYTSKEHTCYYARVLDEHVDLAIEILADMLLNSVFAPGEMEKEKGVILEEIKMYEDSPDEIVHDLFAEAAFAGHPLGQSVLGHEETVKAIRRDDVLAYIDQRYVGENLVVAAAGRLVHDEIVEMVATLVWRFARGSGNDRAIPPNKAFPLRIQPKETEQVHLCVGARSFPRNHADRYAVHVIDVALGGGMSSRFFQELREERGLVYSTYYLSREFPGDGPVYHLCWREPGQPVGSPPPHPRRPRPGGAGRTRTRGIAAGQGTAEREPHAGARKHGQPDEPDRSSRAF